MMVSKLFFVLLVQIVELEVFDTAAEKILAARPEKPPRASWSPLMLRARHEWSETRCHDVAVVLQADHRNSVVVTFSEDSSIAIGSPWRSASTELDSACWPFLFHLRAIHDVVH